MRDEVLSSLGAQLMDTSGYQVSDLNDVEFLRENDQLHLDAVFRLGKDKPFFLSTFNDFLMGSMAENTIPIDEERYKENSPPPSHPPNPLS